MTLIRRHLRRGVVGWLVCHVLTFTALVPRDCCAAHASTEAPPCHDMTAAAPAPVMGDHCDMPASDGAACPMHGATSAAGCAMAGVCHVADAALAAVLWQAAVTPVAPVLAAPAVAPAPHVAIAALSIALALPPDSPPPRS